MPNATNIKKGMYIWFEDAIYEVLDYIHSTPGNKRAFVQTRLRNLHTNNSIERKFSASDKINVAVIEQVPAEFIYQKGNDYVFMNHNNYEEVIISRDGLGDKALYLKPNIEMMLNYSEGKFLGIQLPNAVDLKVVETDPAMKTATITNVNKPAKLETGLVVQVPPFIAQGEEVKVDTRSGKYIERTK